MVIQTQQGQEKEQSKQGTESRWQERELEHSLQRVISDQAQWTAPSSISLTGMAMDRYNGKGRW